VAKSGLYLAALLAAASLPTTAHAAPVSAPVPATGRALLLVPLTLTKIDDLDFGAVVPSSVSGTVTINASTGARTFTGGASGAGATLTSRAYFGGAGSPGQQVVIVVAPPPALVSTSNPLDVLPVLAMTLDGSPIRTVDPVTRTFFFGLGGVIQINGDQPDGIYTADFDVTAVYL
jgi:hypothetical protein